MCETLDSNKWLIKNVSQHGTKVKRKTTKQTARGHSLQCYVK